MEKDISKDILNKIKEEDIKPKSKCSFIAKNVIFWAVFVLTLILGSLSTSIAIFMLRNNYWELHQKIGQSLHLRVQGHLRERVNSSNKICAWGGVK